MKNLLKLIILCFCFVLTSCQTKYIETEVPVYITKTLYENVFKYDSIYIHDSIDRLISGDTVIITKYRNQYKLQLVRDTLIQRDTIPKIVTQKKIEYQKEKINTYLLMWAVLSVAYLIYKFKNFIK